MSTWGKERIIFQMQKHVSHWYSWSFRCCNRSTRFSTNRNHMHWLIWGIGTTVFLFHVQVTVAQIFAWLQELLFSEINLQRFFARIILAIEQEGIPRCTHWTSVWASPFQTDWGENDLFMVHKYVDCLRLFLNSIKCLSIETLQKDKFSWGHLVRSGPHNWPILTIGFALLSWFNYWDRFNFLVLGFFSLKEFPVKFQFINFLFIQNYSHVHYLFCGLT